jgi:hypothetical protein
MNTPDLLHPDGGWHDACWLRAARAHAARNIARSIAAMVVRLGQRARGEAQRRSDVQSEGPINV